MHEAPKRIKRLVRQWAGIAHRSVIWSTRSAICARTSSAGSAERISVFDLNGLIHRYDQDTAREIWKRYAKSNLTPVRRIGRRRRNHQQGGAAR